MKHLAAEQYLRVKDYSSHTLSCYD